MNTRSIFFYLRLTLAIGLIGYLIYIAGIKNIVLVIKEINWIYGLLALFFNCALLFLGAFNVRLLLQVLQPVPLVSFTRFYLYGFAVNLIAPGQFGDASIALFLKKYGVPFKKSGLVYLFDKVTTVLVLFTVAWLGARLFLPQVAAIWFIILPILGLSVMGAVLFLLIRLNWNNHWLVKIQRWLTETLHEARIFQQNLHIIFINVLLTVVKWLVLSLVYFLAFYSMGHYVPFPAIGVIPVLSTLVGYIPISLGGIGTVEWAAIYLFSSQGIEQPVVLSVYLFLRSLQYIQATVLLLIFEWLKPRELQSK